MSGPRDGAAKLLGALGLARRAGALCIGFDAAVQAADSQRAVLALLAQDVSAGTARRVRAACAGKCELETLPLTMQQVAGITQKPAGVLAITNKDLAVLCRNALENAGT